MQQDQTLDLSIRGMTCLDCARHVTSALERVEGVEWASVDYRAGRAHVRLAAGVTAMSAITDALTAAVERAGYHAEPLATDETTSGTVPPERLVVATSVASNAGRTDTPSFAREAPMARRTLVDPVASTPDDPDTTSRADFDLLIIGSGGAGVAAAIQAAGMGAKVAIVEGGTLGGTCVNTGCIPSKMFMEAAAHVHTARLGFPGVSPCAPVVAWREVVRRKDALVGELREAKYADVLASYPGVARLEGRARLLASTDAGVRVRVGDAAAAREHVVRRVIVATGSAPAPLDLLGADAVDALDSTSAMTLDALPDSMIVLGGGPVGVELGQMFARFGVKVILVQRSAHLLPGEDPEIADVLRQALVAEGIEVHTGTAAVRVERDGDHQPAGVVVHVRQGSLDGQLRAERLLVATGRRPSTRALGLEDLGIGLTPNGYIQVDAAMRTANPAVYAAGDVTGGPAYVYVAAAGGRVAAENALKSLHAGATSDEPREFDLSVVPGVTFTSPQVASVGLREDAARARGHHVDVSTLDMADVPRALVSFDRRGLVKLVSESGSGRILGVHAVAPHAGELMGEAALAVRFSLTVKDLSGTLHPYLTWGESLKLVAQGGSLGVQKLSCCA